MPANQDPIHIAGWATNPVRLKNGHATRPVLVFTGGDYGARLHALSAVNIGSANTVKRFIGKRLSVQSLMGVGTLVDGGGSADSITRTAGDFLADGWTVDDWIVVRGATTLANNFLALITAVTATTLTFATATVAGANEVLPVNAELWRVHQQALSTIAANAGNAAGTKALDLLSADLDMIDATPERFMTFGTNDAVFAAAGSTITAGSFIDITPYMGRY